VSDFTSTINDDTATNQGNRRHGRTVFRAAVAVAVALLLLPERHTLLEGARRLSHISPVWFLLAVAAEVVSFLAAAELQRLLLADVGVDVGRMPSLRLISASWSVNAVLPAGMAFSTAYTYRQLTRRGADAGRAAWVLAAGAVLSGGSLVLLGLVGAELCIKALSSWPGGPAVGVAALAVAAGALGWLIWIRRHPSTVRTMIEGLAGVLGAHTRGSRRDVGVSEGSVAWRYATRIPLPPLAGVGVWTASLALATMNWLADLGALGLAFLSLGVAIPWRGLLLAYAVGQVAASLPLLPGSIGVAEAAMALALVAVGTRPAAAVAVVLVYRLISFWLPLPVGLWFWASNRRAEEPASRGVLVGGRTGPAPAATSAAKP
jgi:uncharacterized membrane protein YbhN (UPF0104 family)